MKNSSKTANKDTKDKKIPHPVLLAMSKYFARSEALRDLFMRGNAMLASKYGPDYYTVITEKAGEAIKTGYEKDGDFTADDYIAFHHTTMFLDYWHASLWVCVEAYKELGVQDEAIEKVISNPLEEKLRHYRNGIYHFKKDYFDKKTFSLLDDEKSFEWVNSLQDALHNFLHGHMKEVLAENKMIDPIEYFRFKSVRRNAVCPCGSGKRYKMCHGQVGNAA